MTMSALDPVVSAMFLTLLGVVGLLIGSFLNVVIHRVPAGLSVVKPRSRCPECGHEITAAENIPVVSWLVLRGRCNGCGMRISARYPFVELATAVLFPIVFFRHARSFLLSLDSSVNQDQARSAEDAGVGADPSGGLTNRKLASLASDDGRAGCVMGVALALILLFGLGMAAVTLLFLGDGVGNAPLE